MVVAGGGIMHGGVPVYFGKSALNKSPMLRIQGAEPRRNPALSWYNISCGNGPVCAVTTVAFAGYFSVHRTIATSKRSTGNQVNWKTTIFIKASSLGLHSALNRFYVPVRTIVLEDPHALITDNSSKVFCRRDTYIARLGLDACSIRDNTDPKMRTKQTS